MEKRYQVFVSSTYADLHEERQKVIQTIMEMDCIPSGMELFPAIDEEQWLFIKKVIDDCDYYIIIVGGRYGTLTETGISFTEREYDYAVEKGIKVIAFIHGSPDSIPVGKTDKDPMLNSKLNSFIEKLKKGRLVKFWTNANELPGLVALNLTKTIKTYPAIGWVRSNSIGSTELLSEINELRKENEQIKSLVSNENKDEEIEVNELVDFTDLFTVHGRRKLSSSSSWTSFEEKISWIDIFSIIAPYLFENPHDSSVKKILTSNILNKQQTSYYDLELNDQDFQTIKIQLTAYGLVQVKFTKSTNGGMGLFWYLTKSGHNKLRELRTIKKT